MNKNILGCKLDWDVKEEARNNRERYRPAKTNVEMMRRSKSHQW